MLGAATDGIPIPVLIVDDNAGKRLALRSVLDPLGYAIVEADSGLSALRCLMDQNFAVILMDVRMPVMDGFEAAHLIRQRRQSELTPIIFITAYGSEAMANITAYATGAADFIFSPVPAAELRAKVSVFANLYLRAELLAAQARDLQHSADQLTLLTDSAPIGIFRTDADAKYVYTNPSWSEITNISFDESIGRFWDVILDPRGVAVYPEVTSPGSAHHRFPSRFEIVAPDGCTKVVDWTAKPIVSVDDEIVGWVGALSDVTAEAAASAAMEEARDAAVAAARAQRAFAESASHELKTPTASILGFVEEVLAGDALSPTDRKHLDIARRSALRLTRLIDDLLQLGTSDVQTSRSQCEPTELSSLIDVVLQSFVGLAHSGGIHLSVDAADGVTPESVWAMADPPRLEQAITNLISNALKFTAAGGDIRVLIRANDQTTEIDIVDTGIGIEESAIGSIFDRFYRSQGAVDAGTSGSGLGLAIAQRMIEAQSGQLTATSVLGQGSVFTITLPAVPKLSSA